MQKFQSILRKAEHWVKSDSSRYLHLLYLQDWWIYLMFWQLLFYSITGIRSAAIGGWNQCPSLTRLYHDHDCEPSFIKFSQLRKKYQHFSLALRASILIEILTIFSFSTLRKTVILNLFSHKKICIYAMGFGITIYTFKVTNKLRT